MGFGGCLYFSFRYGNPVENTEESRFFVCLVTLLRKSPVYRFFSH